MFVKILQKSKFIKKGTFYFVEIPPINNTLATFFSNVNVNAYLQMMPKNIREREKVD